MDELERNLKTLEELLTRLRLLNKETQRIIRGRSTIHG